ncbi:serine hydrolase domain-containing protein [Litchfieldia salsa]|uniref:CubicO group peptidase, beta-lactamase class C family n=1 Tax=Litchfieldia salsa TaxID=930152 RepID=A0A1H0Q966_9BACI|nr:serine hydrolase domain-containing protein [Litchfieldia salsa]SDP13933.1 CubicO group peptidase, beta-lactamase class C family [Litchfieldia salsa]
MTLRIEMPEKIGMSSERVEVINEVAKRLVEDGITPAQVTLVARKGMIIHEEAYGKLTPELNSPLIQNDTLFPMCSIAKVITATCIMILVEEGRIGINRPVVDYIPEFQGEGKKEVRISHLLTHTSGIRDDELYAHMDQKKITAVIPPCEDTQDPATHEWLFLGYDTPLWKKPGTAMSYSSYGYQLLGEIIRRVSGMSFEGYVKEKVFNPLGMSDSYFYVPLEERSRVVKRSPNDLCAEWLLQERHLDSTSAAGGLYSTAMDLAKFAQMFLNKGSFDGKRILSPASVVAMTTNQIPGVSSEYRDEVFPEAYWGYGWSINGTKMDGGDLFSPNAFSHWGAAGVFFCADPIYDIVTVYLSVEIDHQKPFKNIYADLFNNVAIAAIEEI